MLSKEERFTKLSVIMALYELSRAFDKHPAFNSPYEGWAVLQKQVDELWEVIKKKDDNRELLAASKRVAAMALRFMIDVCLEAERDKSRDTARDSPEPRERRDDRRKDV